MKSLTCNAGVLVAALFPLAVCAEIDHVALLNQARAKIVENIERLPKYTCLQTVHRSRFQLFPAVQVSSCGHVEISSVAKIRPQVMLAWTDRFKLEVTVSDGAEIFSWAGAQRFQSEDVEKIVGAGMAGTGDFGPFLMSIFGGSASEYEYLGLDATAGASDTPKSPVAIPPGITIKIALRSKIDGETSFAGDAIEGQLMNAIGALVPKGAIVHGRIVRFEQEHQPSNYYALGLKFHSIEVRGSEAPLTLMSLTRGKQILPGPIEKRQGIGMFVFQTGRLSLDQKFVSEWRTE